MKQKPRIKSSTEALRSISEKLKAAATRPNIHGYDPHEKQMDFHTSLARFRLFAGGNRSGKTVGGAAEAIYWLSGTHPYRETPEPPVRLRCVTVDFIEGLYKIVLPEIMRWCPPSYLINSSWDDSWDKELRTLTFANGSFIEFMSYEQDLEKFAGTSRHAIWFDEEPPQDIYHECLLRLIDTGGSVWITMTPVEGMTWTYDEIYEKAKEDDNIHVTEVDLTENPHVNAGEVLILLAGLTDDEKKARIHGQYVQVGGLIYPMFNRELHVVEPFLPNPHWLHIGAMDHGFNNPTAWLWAAVDPDGNVFVYDEHYESGKIVGYHANRVHDVNRSHRIDGDNFLLPSYYIGDPAIKQVNPITGTSVQLEYLDYGIPILEANNEVRAGLNRVARYLIGNSGKPRLYITSNCVNLIRELARYRWSTWASKKLTGNRNKKEEPTKKDDHACDALRYLIASRPELDDGTIIPSRPDTMGASIPAPVHGRLVPAIGVGERKPSYDDVLGSDW